MTSYGMLKAAAILLTVLGGIFGISGSTHAAPNEQGRRRLNWIGRISIAIILAAGLTSLLLSWAENEQTRRDARANFQWNATLSSPVTRLALLIGVENGYVSIAELSGLAQGVLVEFNDPKTTHRLSVESKSTAPTLDGSLFWQLVDTAARMPRAAAGGELWLKYPGSDDWLCWWTPDRAANDKASKACSWQFGISGEDLPFRSLAEIENLRSVEIVVPDGFNIEATMFKGFNGPFVTLALTLEADAPVFLIPTILDISVPTIDATKTPAERSLRTRITGPDLVWAFRQQFREYAERKADASDPSPMTMLAGLMPEWLAQRLRPPGTKAPPTQILRQATGQITKLDGYYPRTPNQAEREHFDLKRAGPS